MRDIFSAAASPLVAATIPLAVKFFFPILLVAGGVVFLASIYIENKEVTYEK